MCVYRRAIREKDEKGRDMVGQLLRAIYGLKQAGRNWFRMARKILLRMGFKQSDIDQCLFKIEKDGEVMYVVLYVDDIYGASNSKRMLKWLVRRLLEDVQVSEHEGGDWYLKIRVKETEKGLLLQQDVYVDELAKQFRMEEAKKVNIPMDPGLDLQMPTRRTEDRRQALQRTRGKPPLSGEQDKARHILRSRSVSEIQLQLHEKTLESSKEEC